MRESWWHWADPDGAYVGNSLNILVGNHTYYLDHPGLPTQDALALGFGAQYLASRGSFDSRQEFIDDRFLDLDQARPLYRTWAIGIFLLSTLIVYVAVGRLLGHWTWGLAGGLLFVSAPGLGPISFILRPDAMVAALCLAVGFFAVTGFERRSALRYTAAAALLGFALTWKLVAIGMVVPLAVAALWRVPGPQWFGEVGRGLGTRVRRHALWLAPLAFAWLVLCIVFNRERLPIVQTADQREILVGGATLLLGYAGLAFVAERFRIPWADRIFRLVYAWLLLAFVVGLALPASLVLDDGIQMLVSMKESLTGGRVNEDIEPFENFTWDQVSRYPLAGAAIVVGLGFVAGVLGVVRRTYWPFLLALGSLVLATMAAARYSYDYYYAPAFAVAVPGALWLLRRRGRVGAPFYVWIPVAALLAWTVSEVQSWEQAREQEIDASAQALGDELLRPGEAVLVNDYRTPIEDVRFDSLVDAFVDHVPAYPYRFVNRPATAVERGLTPRYVASSAGELPPPGETAEVYVAGVGPFVVEGTETRFGPDDAFGVARIVQSPPVEP